MLSHLLESRVNVATGDRVLEGILLVSHVRVKQLGYLLNFLFYTVNMLELEVVRGHWINRFDIRAGRYRVKHRSHVLLFGEAAYYMDLARWMDLLKLLYDTIYGLRVVAHIQIDVRKIGTLLNQGS